MVGSRFCVAEYWHVLVRRVVVEVHDEMEHVIICVDNDELCKISSNEVSIVLTLADGV